MFRIWCERTMPDEYLSQIKGMAVPIGAASETPETPWIAVGEADAILAGSALNFDERVFEAAPRLKVIARTGIGYDNVDLAAATHRGIAVCNAPDAPTRSTAEHTLTLLLAVAKQIRRNQGELEGGEQKGKNYFNSHAGVEVWQKTLGLIGAGRIGRLVAQLARGLGMEVVAYDPLIAADVVAEAGVTLLPTISEVLRQADFVSLHVPFTAQTQHLIDATRLNEMKQGSFLINCARAGVVDTKALAASLDRGHLAGAAIDVYDNEPPPVDHPLLNRNNVIATAHIAGATDAGKDRLWRTAIDQALRVLNGERAEYLVNDEVLSDR